MASGASHSVRRNSRLQRKAFPSRIIHGGISELSPREAFSSSNEEKIQQRRENQYAGAGAEEHESQQWQRSPRQFKRRLSEQRESGRGLRRINARQATSLWNFTNLL
jgi:hypothetical protein